MTLSVTTTSTPTSQRVGYWPLAVVVATACGAAALALAARHGWRADAPQASLPRTAARLAAGQVVLFAVLETVERLAVGGRPAGFVTSAQFALGVVLQIA